MSEGVENFLPEHWFWTKRAHYIYDAMVKSGVVPVDVEQYEAEKSFWQHRCGFSEAEAAELAFAVVRWKPPSECEVNPW